MITTIEEAKTHLRVQHDAEDDLIAGLIEAAEDHVFRYLERSLPWIDDDGVEAPVPGSVRAAILLIVGDLYANREGRFVGVSQSDNPAVRMLLAPYRVNLGA
jgi:hypothetical protein